MPRVAICVCTHSRPQGLRRVLRAARRIQLDGRDPQAVEMIVVDNDPNPETKAICDQAAADLPIKLHYEAEPRVGITHARNRAARAALQRGADFMAFIDDDDEPHPDWLSQLLRRQAATDADIVFGVFTLDSGHLPAWAKKSRLYRLQAKGRDGLPPNASTNNVLIGRKITQQVATANGGEIFRQRFLLSGGEDRDFFLRARALGARLTRADQSVIRRIHEPARYTARGILRRGFKIGGARVILAQTHGGMTGLVGAALMFCPLLLTALLCLLPFSFFCKGYAMLTLYRLAKSGGVLYTAALGRNIQYYARES